MAKPGDHSSTMRLPSTLICAVIYCGTSPVFAASYFLPSGIGSGPFSSCSGVDPSYTCSSNINIGKDHDLRLTADVTLVINGNLDIGDNFVVIANGNTLTLDVGGNVKIAKDSSFAGNITADGDVDIGSDTTFTGNISADGNVKIDKDISFTGNITADGNIDIQKDADITGEIIAGGNIDIAKDVDITGNVTAGGNLDIAKDTTVDGICTPSHPQCTGIGGPAIDHYAISHGGAGITCEPKTITVTAHSADHSPYNVASNVVVTITTDPAVDAIDSSPVTITSGQSSARFTLTKTSVTSAPHIDIDVTDGTLSETSGSADATDDPKLAFYDSQFQFVTSTSLPLTTDIDTQIGGKPSSTSPNAQSLYLRAVRSDDTTGSPACVAALDAGTHAIDMGYQCTDSANCSTTNELSVSNNLLYNSGSSTTIARNNGATTSNTLPVTLNFDASGHAPLSFLYNNVGEIALFANAYTTSIGGVINSDVSNQFVVRPFALVLDFDNGGGTYNMRQLDWSGVPGNLDGSSSNNSYADPTSNPQDSSVFQIAGTNFPVEIAGVLWQASDDSPPDGEPDDDANLYDNTLASLFGQESSRVVEITHSLEEPTGGNVGILTSAFTNPYADGRTEGTMSWNEVGIIDIGLVLNSYLADTTFTPGSIAQDVGRFTPATLLITSTNNGMFTSTNLNGALPYTYVGQAFSYDPSDRPAFRVTALNALSPATVTVNYTEDWGKLDAASINLTVPTSDSVQDGTTPSTLMALTYNPGSDGFRDPATSNPPEAVNGIFDAEFTNDDFTYIKDANSRVSPFMPSVNLVINHVTDSDGIGSGSITLNPTGMEPIRFGRMRMINAHGSELLPLVMDYRLEYFNAGNWLLHADDEDSVFAIGDITSNPAGTSASAIAATAPAGKFGITLSAPGEGNEGAYMITTEVLGSGQPWLRYDWDGIGGFDDDPSAIATFGIYKGNPVNIYIQQTYP